MIISIVVAIVIAWIVIVNLETVMFLVLWGTIILLGGSFILGFLALMQ